MSETLTGTQDVMRFEHEEHDVTCCLELLCCGSTKLIMGEEEVEFRKSSFCGLCSGKKRGPYGELGTVDTSDVCCFKGFSAASLMADVVQCTGAGCEGDKVGGIVTELKKRQAFRGDRAKVRMGEATLASLEELNTKINLIMEHLSLDVPEKKTSPAAAEMTR